MDAHQERDKKIDKRDVDEGRSSSSLCPQATTTNAYADTGGATCSSNSQTTGREKKEQLEILESLGFEPELCRIGLIRSDGTVTGAVEYIIGHEQENDHIQDSDPCSHIEGHRWASGGKAVTLTKTVTSQQTSLGDSRYLETGSSTKPSVTSTNRTKVPRMPKAVKPPPKAATAARGRIKGSIKTAPETVPAAPPPSKILTSKGKFSVSKVVPTGTAPTPDAGDMLSSSPPFVAYPPGHALTAPGVTAVPGPFPILGPNEPSFPNEEGEEQERRLSGEFLVSATLVPKSDEGDSRTEKQRQQQVALATATPLTPFEAAKVFLRGQGKICLVALLFVVAAAVALAVGVGLTVGLRGDKELVMGWGVNCTGGCKKECDEVLRWRNCKVGQCSPAIVGFNCSGYEFNMEYECYNKSGCNGVKGQCRDDCHSLL